MNRALRILTLVFAGVLLIMAAGCSNKDVAATVNGDTIKKTDINAQLDQLKAQYPQMFNGKDGATRLKEFYTRLLDQEVSKLLVKQEAAKEGISVSDADVQKQIDSLKKGFPNDAAFQDALKKNNMTLDKLTEQEKVQLESQKLLDKVTKGITVSDAEMQAYYDKNKKNLFTDKAATHAAHILFDEKDRATAEKVLAQIKADPTKFAALAKQYSKDPGSGKNGGDLGWPTSPFVPEFQKAIDGAQPGALIPTLIHTQFGWHIIKVIEKRKDAIKPFSAVKDQVRQILIQQKQADAFQKLLDQLKKQAKITYPSS